MTKRSNADIIRVVTKWQESGYFHELTCRVDSRHAALVAVERHGKVVLDCPTCGAVQDEIPEAVLGSEAAIDLSDRLAVNLLEAEERRQVARDSWVTVAVVFIGTAMLGNFFFGILVGLVAGAAAGAIARLATREDKTRP